MKVKKVNLSAVTLCIRITTMTIHKLHLKQHQGHKNQSKFSVKSSEHWIKWWQIFEIAVCLRYAYDHLSSYYTQHQSDLHHKSVISRLINIYLSYGWYKHIFGNWEKMIQLIKWPTVILELKRALVVCHHHIPSMPLHGWLYLFCNFSCIIPAQGNFRR